MYSADLEYVIQIVMIDVLKCIFKGTGSVISSVKSRKSWVYIYSREISNILYSTDFVQMIKIKRSFR